MSDTSRFGLTSHPASFGLVAFVAVAGVVGCAAGAMAWGLLGLLIGLVAAWCSFVVGLFGLYQREKRAQLAAEDLATEAPPVAAAVETASV